jgi:hypothetical protein
LGPSRMASRNRDLGRDMVRNSRNREIQREKSRFFDPTVDAPPPMPAHMAQSGCRFCAPIELPAIAVVGQANGREVTGSSPGARALGVREIYDRRITRYRWPVSALSAWLLSGSVVERPPCVREVPVRSRPGALFSVARAHDHRIRIL